MQTKFKFARQLLEFTSISDSVEFCSTGSEVIRVEIQVDGCDLDLCVALCTLCEGRMKSINGWTPVHHNYPLSRHGLPMRVFIVMCISVGS
jgi:hypothetical protein